MSLEQELSPAEKFYSLCHKDGLSRHRRYGPKKSSKGMCVVGGHNEARRDFLCLWEWWTAALQEGQSESVGRGLNTVNHITSILRNIYILIASLNHHLLCFAFLQTFQCSSVVVVQLDMHSFLCTTFLAQISFHFHLWLKHGFQWHSYEWPFLPNNLWSRMNGL